jgi:SAM-dependent methyltransferase
MDLEKIRRLQEKPVLFSSGDAQFWVDPYISGQLLKVHLDPSTEAASRPPEAIRKTVDWITNTLGLKIGDHLLDLGCGPGLYAVRFAQQGLHVTGVDFSQNSIDYAIQKAHEDGLQTTYRCEDYLQLKDETQYDVALLIYGDFCVLSPVNRTRLLANIHRALKPGGHLVLDVSTPVLRQRVGANEHWYADHDGFWRTGHHLVMERGFSYDDDIHLDQFVVIDEYGEICIYHHWFQDYTPERIRKELEANRFKVESLWGDLAGTPYHAQSEWIGVVARKE